MKRYVVLIFAMFVFVLSIQILTQGQTLKQKWKKADHWLIKANTNKTFDLIVIGDSRIFFAINPDVLKKNAEHSAYNFAFPTISFTRHYLKKASQRLNKHGHVFIGLTPEAFTNFKQDTGLRDFEKAGPLFLNRLFNGFRMFWPTLNLGLYLKKNKLPLMLEPKENEIDIYHENGWIESNQGPTTNSKDMALGYRELFLKHPFQSEILTNLSAMTKEWKNKGHRISFFWVCFDELVCSEESVFFQNDIKVKINQTLINSGASFIDIKTLNYLTIDGDHLTGPEANRFSNDLLIKLRP